jgi:hypothetical protein
MFVLEHMPVFPWHALGILNMLTQSPLYRRFHASGNNSNHDGFLKEGSGDTKTYHIPTPDPRQTHGHLALGGPDFVSRFAHLGMS